MRLPRWARGVLLGILALFLGFVLALAALVAYGNWRLNTYHPRFPRSLPCHSIIATGRPYVDVYEDIYQEGFLAWIPNGSQIVFNYGEKDIFIVDTAGTKLQNLVTVSPFERASYGIYADVSPDGTQVVYTSCEFPTGTEYEVVEQELYNYEIAVMKLDGSGRRRLTENRDLDHFPVWSPDGKQIAFLSTLHRMSKIVNYFPSNVHLYAMAADGSDVRRLAESEHRGAALLPPVWSPDGKYVAYLEMWLPGKGLTYDREKTILYTVRVADSMLTAIGISTLVPPAWSPDGRFLAFVQTEKPRGVYTVRPDGTDMQRVMKLNRPTIHVSWSPDGSAFYAITDELELYVIEADGRGLRQVSLGTSSNDTGQTLVAWSPDGRRIAVYIPGPRANGIYVRSQLYTVAPDGTDRRDPDKCGQQLQSNAGQFPAVGRIVMNYSLVSPEPLVVHRECDSLGEPDCSPHPMDIMAIFAIYQTLD